MMSRIAFLAALGMTTAATGAVGAATTDGPVALGIDKQGALVTLVVSGAAAAATDVTYELDVVGASTLHQKGRATLGRERQRAAGPRHHQRRSAMARDVARDGGRQDLRTARKRLTKNTN